MEKSGNVGSIILENSFSKCHHNYVMSVLHSPKHKKFITTTFNGPVRFFDEEKRTLEKSIEDLHDRIAKVTQWDDDHFLSYSEDGDIFLLSYPKQRMIRKIFNNSTRILAILKLSDDEIIVSMRESKLCIISFTDGNILRELEQKTTHWLSTIVLSLKFDRCFYINCSFPHSVRDSMGVKNCVSLVNPNDNSSVSFPNEGHSRTICVFTHSKSNEEMMCCDGNKDEIYYYNMSSQKLVRKLKTERNVSCIRFHRNIILVSTLNGGFHGYSAYKLGEGDDEDNRPIFSGGGTKDLQTTRGMIDFKVMNHYEEKNEVEIVSGSYDDTARIFKITNFPRLHHYNDNFSKKDLMERIDFLFQEASCLFYGDEETGRTRIVFENGLKFENIWICLL